MQQNISYHENIAGLKPPPRVRTICILGAYALFMITVLAFQAWRAFSKPVPNWMTESERWYDYVLQAVSFASIAVACFTYVRYRSRISRTALVAKPRRWRFRRELRFVLYVWAATLAMQLPLAIYKTFVALNDNQTPYFARNVVSAFPIGGMIYPLVGVAAVIYDRRRVTREERQAGNLCPKCGYDLRATPDRCPECGMLTKRGISTAD